MSEDGSHAQQVMGALAAAVSALGGTARPQQQHMVAAVQAALKDGEHLLLQAGTGTGKSLGYLIPAALRAVKHDETVVVATATLGLQRQLVEKDAPVVADAVQSLGVRRPRIALLKGRANYLCRLKLAEAPEDSLEADRPRSGSRLQKQALEVREWAEQTETGDRDDFSDSIDQRIWRAVSVSGRECVGRQRCPFGDECFAELARMRAVEADVVLTNHAMLAIDMQGQADTLPEHTAVIVDEAHDLTERITAAGTQSLTAAQVETLANGCRKVGAVEIGESLLAQAERLEQALQGWGDILGERKRAQELTEALTLSLTRLRDETHRALSEIGADGDPGAADGRKQAVRAAAQDVHDLAGRLLACSPSDVTWWSVAEAGIRVSCAPLSVRSILQQHLLAERTMVATSATLTLGGTFDQIAMDLGLAGADVAGSWQSLDVGSPFDYANQAILYAPRNLPRPGRDGPADAVLAEICELVAAAGGRTLVLASSWRSVDAIEQALRKCVPNSVSVIVQERGVPPSAAVAQFTAEHGSVLVGTMSLWQGIDVVGSSLSSVVIEKIPFPRPDDPVVAARQQQIDEAGGRGFFSVSVPRAALLLAQGTGRLIRSTQDRGVVSILDSRFVTAGYGGFLRKSLPDYWTTHDRQAVLQALRRLAQEPTEE